MEKGYAAPVHKDRLMLYMPNYERVATHMGYEVSRHQDVRDVLLAEGLKRTVKYLRAKHLLNGGTNRKSVIDRIGGLTADDVRVIAAEAAPKHTGKASVLLADVRENGSVAMTHAKSPMYELRTPEEAEAQ